MHGSVLGFFAYGALQPRLLDLGCKAGGATRGYQLAGFHVTGVDIEPQPHYVGDAFILADMLTVPLDGYHAIHASPPCQMWSAYRRARPDRGDEHYVNHIPTVRRRLQAAGVPWVIENVPHAPLHNWVQLCGTGFALDVERHRRFESNVPLLGMPCAHGRNAPRFNRGSRHIRPNDRRTVAIGEWRIPLPIQQRAMGVDWMTVKELSQAIPPAYTHFIGEQLLAHLQPCTCACHIGAGTRASCHHCHEGLTAVTGATAGPASRTSPTAAWANCSPSTPSSPSRRPSERPS